MSQKIAVGYYPAWWGQAPSPEQIDYTHLTHIAYAFTGSGASVNDALAKRLVAAARAAGRKSLVSIGGASESGLAVWIAASTSNRTALTTALLKRVLDYGFDGIDIDVEPIASNHESGYESFVTNLRTVLPPGKTVSAAIGGWNEVLMGRLHRQFDWIGLMSYDLHDKPGAAHTPLTGSYSAASFVNKYVAAGVPKSKLCIGIAHYGYRWSGSTPTTVSYRDILKLPAGTVLSPSDTPQTVADKMAYVRNQGLAGVIIWELTQGYVDGAFPLLTAMGNQPDATPAPTPACWRSWAARTGATIAGPGLSAHPPGPKTPTGPISR